MSHRYGEGALESWCSRIFTAANVGDNGVAAKNRELRKQQRPRLPFITWFVRLRLPPAGSWTGQNHYSNRLNGMGRQHQPELRCQTVTTNAINRQQRFRSQWIGQYVNQCGEAGATTKPQHQLRSTGDYCSVANRWATMRVTRHDESDLRCESPSHHPIGDDDLSTRDIKSDHQEIEVASTSMGRPRSPYLACALS